MLMLAVMLMVVMVVILVIVVMVTLVVMLMMMVVMLVVLSILTRRPSPYESVSAWVCPAASSRNRGGLFLSQEIESNLPLLSNHLL